MDTTDSRDYSSSENHHTRPPRPVVAPEIIHQQLLEIKAEHPKLVTLGGCVAIMASLLGTAPTPEEQQDQYEEALERYNNGRDYVFQFHTRDEIALRFCQRYLALINRKRPA